MTPPTKRCSRCGEDKPRAEFYRLQTARDGLHCQCRDCYLERQRALYHAKRRGIVLTRQPALETRLCACGCGRSITRDVGFCRSRTWYWSQACRRVKGEMEGEAA